MPTRENKNNALKNIYDHQGLENLRDFIRWAAGLFQRAELYYGHGTDNPWDEAIQLICFSLAIPWEKHGELLDARLTLSERAHICELIRRRIEERVPVAYLTQTCYQAGLQFYVDERVLIPRSPIAELIVNQFQPWLSEPPQRMLDLCCGSGCLGILALEAFPQADLVLADLSKEALAVARVNVEKHQLSAQTQLQASDLLDQVQGRFDLIICNPPYVGVVEMQSLPQEYRHEPEQALASGELGLDLVQRLLKQAADYLSPQGLLVVEVGNSDQALQAQYPEVPFVWQEFEQGGHGVFILTAEQLEQYRKNF